MMRVFYQIPLTLVTFFLVLSKYSKIGVLSAIHIINLNNSDVINMVEGIKHTDVNKSWNVSMGKFYLSSGINFSTELSDKSDAVLVQTEDKISAYAGNVVQEISAFGGEVEESVGIDQSECNGTDIARKIQNMCNLRSPNDCSAENEANITKNEYISRMHNNTYTSNLELAVIPSVIDKNLSHPFIRNNSHYFQTTASHSQAVTCNNSLCEVNAVMNENIKSNWNISNLKSNEPVSSVYIFNDSLNSTSRNSTSKDKYHINVNNSVAYSPNGSFPPSDYAGTSFPQEEKQVKIKMPTFENFTEKTFLVNTTARSNNDTAQEMYSTIKNDAELKHVNRRHHRRQKPKYGHSKVPKRVTRGHSATNKQHRIHLVPDILNHERSLIQNDEAAHFGKGIDDSDMSLQREFLQSTKDILRQWLESSIIDLSHDQDEFQDSDEDWRNVYDDHQAGEWQNDYDIIDEIFNQDWFLNSGELSDWLESEENEYFACVAGDLWDHFVSLGYHVYKGCKFTSEYEHAELAIRWRRYISRAPVGRLFPAKCKKGMRRVKKVCKEVWY